MLEIMAAVGVAGENRQNWNDSRVVGGFNLSAAASGGQSTAAMQLATVPPDVAENGSPASTTEDFNLK